MIHDGLDAVAVGAALLLAVGLLLVLRARLLARSGACVSVSFRRRGSPWSSGVARYDGDALRCYRGVGPGLRADAVVRRRDLAVDVRRYPEGAEVERLPRDLEVLQCRDADGDVVELALPQEAVTGFLAWMESVPPGTSVR